MRHREFSCEELVIEAVDWWVLFSRWVSWKNRRSTWNTKLLRTRPGWGTTILYLTC